MPVQQFFVFEFVVKLPVQQLVFFMPEFKQFVFKSVVFQLVQLFELPVLEFIVVFIVQQFIEPIQ